MRSFLWLPLGLLLLNAAANNPQRVVSTDDFTSLRNFVLLHNETSKVINDISRNCPSYALHSSEFNRPLSFELFTNCSGWSAVRVTEHEGDNNLFDYYVNFEQHTGGNRIVITSSFGGATDSKSLDHFYALIPVIKKSMLEEENLKSLTRYLLTTAQHDKNKSGYSYQVIATNPKETIVEVSPADKHCPAYRIQQNKVGVDMVARWNYLSPEFDDLADSPFFAHYSTLLLHAKGRRLSDVQ